MAGSIIRYLPFADGNERTAMYGATCLLGTFGYDPEAEQQEPEDFAVGIADGESETQDSARWFGEHKRRMTSGT